jgi:hypothetical protein
MDGFGGKSIVYRVKRSIKMYSIESSHCNAQWGEGGSHLSLEQPTKILREVRTSPLSRVREFLLS